MAGQSRVEKHGVRACAQRGKQGSPAAAQTTGDDHQYARAGQVEVVDVVGHQHQGPVPARILQQIQDSVAQGQDSRFGPLGQPQRDQQRVPGGGWQRIQLRP
ncbi:hypothetical protein Abr02nite_83970 [Paractinoplanes brasiliensis]|nr:hypothetical protein [Actinoplanes brasiliensis]GID33414.1 hypothetical protein Abr02nite_83970 [Actinoplanes brasiliensis]